MLKANDTLFDASDHRLGNLDAPLWLLEYGDYEGPFYIQAEPLTRHLAKTYGGRMTFAFRHFTQAEIHPHAELAELAELAAEAAEAAAAQSRFWPMHARLFDRPHRLEPSVFAGCAASIGLDMLRFAGDLGDRVHTGPVQSHRLAGERMGVRATQTCFLSGSIVDISFGLQHLEAAIQRELVQA
ncbi:MAG: thioredoxin domain-containing protein [Luteimonas sp.]|nr:thioredoxin domain-containing protein [Luteimonas sp.]